MLAYAAEKAKVIVQTNGAALGKIRDDVFYHVHIFGDDLPLIAGNVTYCKVVPGPSSLSKPVRHIHDSTLDNEKAFEEIPMQDYELMMLNPAGDVFKCWARRDVKDCIGVAEVDVARLPEIVPVKIHTVCETLKTLKFVGII